MPLLNHVISAGPDEPNHTNTQKGIPEAKAAKK
jgi:hypothetical protein